MPLPFPSMGARSFQHEIEIAVAPGQLQGFLLDLHNYVALHPLIESIRDLPPTAELPHAKRYEVVDRVPTGPFLMKVVYIAALEEISETEVRGHAWQKPGVHLVTSYQIEPTDPGCRLTEVCQVEAPFFLGGFVTRQASAAHAETLQKMKQHLEAPSDR